MVAAMGLPQKRPLLTLDKVEKQYRNAGVCLPKALKHNKFKHGHPVALKLTSHRLLIPERHL